MSPLNIKKIIISDDFRENFVERLRESHCEVDHLRDISAQGLLDIIHEYDAIIVRSRTQVTREVIEKGKKLKLIGRAGVGTDNIDLEAATERQILVINAPNGNTISACELTCAHILNVSRNMFAATKSLKDGVWNKKDFMGLEVAGKTLGVVGLGRIGQAVATRMKAFEMDVIAYDPVTPASVATELGIEFVDLETIWKRSDYITVHVPLIPATKYLINSDTIAKCKQGVIMVNVARGGIIDEEALLKGLISRKVHAAALDVFEEEPPINEELLRHPYLYPTPHLGASTHDAQVRVGQEIVDQVIQLNQGKKTHGIVNANKLDLSFLK